MRYKCPKCGGKLVKIVYGLPTQEACEKERQKKIYLGGCKVTPCSPDRYCYNCNESFSTEELRFEKELKDWEKDPSKPLPILKIHF